MKPKTNEDKKKVILPPPKEPIYNITQMEIYLLGIA